jgi:hypothetical protein
VRGLSARLLDALAILLVRLHLAGFYWGDCSLSNTLFRRDAGALAAYCVDMETGEWHETLTDGQRRIDLEVTELNVAGGLMDLQAQLGLPPDPDPLETAEALRRRYDQLWVELTTEEIIGRDERYRIEARMRRLNELGFDVDEVELVRADGGDRMILRTSVSEQGHHRRRLLGLTGLEAQENQARSLLNDLANFRASEEHRTGRPIAEQVAAYRWLTEVFEPTVAAIPHDLHGKLEPAEVFHEVIEHKWFLSESAGQRRRQRRGHRLLHGHGAAAGSSRAHGARRARSRHRLLDRLWLSPDRPIATVRARSGVADRAWPIGRGVGERRVNAWRMLPRREHPRRTPCCSGWSQAHS